jgi:hypothetical protein
MRQPVPHRALLLANADLRGLSETEDLRFWVFDGSLDYAVRTPRSFSRVVMGDSSYNVVVVDWNMEIPDIILSEVIDLDNSAGIDRVSVCRSTTQ